MGPIGKYQNDYTYTYDGPDSREENIQIIKVESKLTYAKPIEAVPSAALPFKIKEVNLKPTVSRGTIRFNSALGRIESSDMILALEGELTIEIGGGNTKVELHQAQKTTITASDSNPLKAR